MRELRPWPVCGCRASVCVWHPSSSSTSLAIAVARLSSANSLLLRPRCLPSNCSREWDGSRVRATSLPLRAEPGCISSSTHPSHSPCLPLRVLRRACEQAADVAHQVQDTEESQGFQEEAETSRQEQRPQHLESASPPTHSPLPYIASVYRAVLTWLAVRCCRDAA